MVILIGKLSKKERQEQLLSMIDKNPMITDEELANAFSISIQTIRLDRMELGIPELRERMKRLAEKNLQVRSLELNEVIGEVIDLKLDKSGISLFIVDEEHLFYKTGIARGHHLFAQANSLSVAIIDAEVALTVSANIRFYRSVYKGDKCIAKAQVIEKIDENKSTVSVNTYVNNNLVFSGEFIIYKSSLQDKKGEII